MRGGEFCVMGTYDIDMWVRLYGRYRIRDDTLLKTPPDLSLERALAESVSSDESLGEWSLGSR